MTTPRPNAAIWLLLSALIIVLDLWTKQLALEHLRYGQPVVFLEGFWNWTLAYNTGAAFSFLSEASGWQRWFFAALAIGISGLLTVWLFRTPRGEWRNALPFALIIGGALGNLVDRVRFGYVVDFIDWHWRGYHWPAFNIADSAIVVGAIALIVFGFGHRPKES
jgi:signal peptidase II